MTLLGPAPSPRPGLVLPSASAEQMSVGRGLGVWVEATNKHHCDPEPPAQQKQEGASKDPRSIRKWRLDLPEVGGGGRKEVGRGSGRCWMGWVVEGSLQKPDGVGAQAAGLGDHELWSRT